MSDIRKISAGQVDSNQQGYLGSLGNLGNGMFNLPITNNGTAYSFPQNPLINWPDLIETAADLLASGIITSENYFKLKALMRSSDPEVRAMGLKFIEEKSKLEI